MSTFPVTAHLRVQGEPVYIHIPCLDAMTWGPSMVSEYGPIEQQGCDRCESAADGNWRAVRVDL